MPSGRNGPSSSTPSSSRMASSATPVSLAGPVTNPVTVRRPSGTSTRVPRAGSAMPVGTRYVRSGRDGTGTATETSISRALFLQTLHHHLHVLPHLALCRRSSQQVRRVKGRHDDGVAHLVEAAAQTRD